MVQDLQIVIRAINQASSELRRAASDISKLNQAAAQTQGVDKLNRSMGALSRFGADFKRDAGRIAVGFIGAQAAVTAFSGALSGTIGAAISFESSFAGIRKTVDATEAEFAKLAQGNRDLAKSIPLSVNQINALGEAAGQLGISGVDNILKFERVVADVGNTTNLSAGEAATAFAQIANVVGLPIKDIDRLGSAIVDLGNKGASTEKDIVDFSQRIAGAGKIAGLTVAEITGIASAFASVGIEAEAGGTAIQKVLIELTRAAATGGDKLAVFAKTAGITATEFQKLARADGAEAFTRFVEGLGRAGDDAFAVLEKLGLEDQRLIRSFLSAAGAGDLLRRSVETGTRAFAENTALTAEAEKRYATTAAQLQILKNNLLDIGISVGNEVLPALNQSSKSAVTLLNAARPLAPVFQSAAKGAAVFGLALVAIKLAQFASQAAAARVAIGGLGAQLRTPVGGAIALAAALTVADIAFRKISDQGFLELFSDADEKARGATEAVSELDEALARIAQTSTDPKLAQAAGIDAFTRELEKALDAVRRARSEFESKPALRLGDSVIIDFSFATSNEAQEAKEVLKEVEGAADALIAKLADFAAAQKDPIAALEGLRDRLREQPGLLSRLGSPINKLIVEYQELAHASESAEEALFRQRLEAGNFLGVYQRLAKEAENAAAAQAKFGDGLPLAELQKLAQAVDKTALAEAGLSEAAIQAADDHEKLASALQSALSVFEGADPFAEALQLEIDLLEQQRFAAIAAGQSTSQLDDRISDLSSALASHNQNTQVAQQVVRLYAAQLESAGVDAAEAAERTGRFAEQLRKLPTSQQVEIALALPDLEMNRFIRFLELLRLGVEVPIALKIAQAPAQRIERRPGGGGRTFVPDIELHNEQANTQALLDIEAKRAHDAITGLTDDFAGSTAAQRSLSAAASDALTVVEALSDGIIDFSEAMKLGLSDSEVVAAELAAAEAEVADEAFRARIEFLKLGVIMGRSGLTGEAFQLQLAFAAIGEELRKSGRTAEQFELDEFVRPELEKLRSAIQEVLSQPTREDLTLQLQRAELQRQRLLLGGNEDDPRVKRIDAQLKSLDNLIRLRENEVEIMRIKAQLADRSISTDIDQVRQSELLTIAIGLTSVQFDNLRGIVGLQSFAIINLGNAANETAAALRGIGAPQSFAVGVRGFSGGLAQVHKDELLNLPRGTDVFTAAESRRMLAAGTPAPNFTVQIYVTADSQASEESMRKLAKMVREEAETALRRAAFRGSYVTSGAYTPS